MTAVHTSQNRLRGATAPFRLGALVAILLTFAPLRVADAQTQYRFERMWPTLEQPWYFEPGPVATAADGAVYVSDREMVQKFDAHGHLLAEFKSGALPGQFQFWFPYGVAVAPDSSLYVTDTLFDQVQKFDATGAFELLWGNSGTGDGQFDGPVGVAVAPDGSVYVADSDNSRIQKFDSDGIFLTKWGSAGSGPGQFDGIRAVSVGPDGSVYVACFTSRRIQRFDANGQYLTQWGSMGTGDGQFDSLSGMVADRNGFVYAYDDGNLPESIQKFGANGQFVSRFVVSGDASSPASHLTVAPDGSFYVSNSADLHVRKFSATGQLIAVWTAAGNGAGQFQFPLDVAAAPDGSIYASDNSFAQRVQKFDPQGNFILQWGSLGTGDGQFNAPGGLGVAPDSSVYVADTYNQRIQKFNSSGVFQLKWGAVGSGPGQFSNPQDVAVAPDGSVYVADTVNHRIQKFTASGSYLLEWGSFGGPVSGVGQFDSPKTIAVGPTGLVYVSDTNNYRIQRFDANGQNGIVWGGPGNMDGFFQSFPWGIATASDGSVFVAEGGFGFNPFGTRFQKFDSNGQFVSKFGEGRYGPGQFGSLVGLTVAPSGAVYTLDFDNNRMQKFVPITVPNNARAIVVAAGGPFPGNVLWDATQYAANFAYRSLAFQGFTRDRIQYLSSNTQLDLDQNGLADDVDADCTNANLQSAIQTWASGAENLVIYLVDHGGNGQFRMSESETLTAAQLESWIDAVDPSISGKITIVYDSCQSGSFMSALTGANRAVITSASGSETAKFISTGTVSFSNFFWEQVFNGNDVNTAFTIAQQAMAPYQSALLDADGDGITNEAADLTAVTGIVIGNGTNFNLFRPIIAGPVGIVGGTTLSSGSTATIFADDVTDPNDPGDANDNGTISRVWAVLRPPNFTPPSPDNPVTNFPTVELLPVGGNRFEGTYSGFTTAGTYNIVIYALDNNTETSLPLLTTLNVISPLRKKAIIAVGTDPASPEWPVAQEAAIEAYKTLQFQQYADSGPNEDIKFYAPVTFSVGVDGTLTSLNLQTAINTWAASNTQDLVIFLIGPGNTDSFRLNSTQNLSASTFDGWLDTLQATLPGVVTVLYDGPKSGSFRDNLLPPASKKRIFMASTNDTQSASFVPAGAICFSRFFWRNVANGANVNQAFITAKLAMDNALKLQVPGLDDNANGVVNEKTDGPLLARLHNLGTGIVLAGDAPLIAGDTGDAEIASGTTQSFGAIDATSTGTIATVWAMIMPPGYSPAQPQRLVTADLTPTGGNDYSINYAGFTEQGDYTVAVFAEDVDGVLSLPRSMVITQPSNQFTEAPTAESLRNNFNALDSNHNGGLTLAEAQAQIPGMTLALFNQLDDSANGLLSMTELLDATVGDPGEADDVYINFAFAGVELGTPENPFNSVTEAAAYAAAPGTLHFAPGTTSESILLTRQVTLRSTGGTVRIGAP